MFQAFNRRFRTLRFFSVSASILVYFFVLSIGADQFVLCFGSDGHVAVEPALNGCCNASSPAHSHTGLSFEPVCPETGDHCGSCIDVLLSSYFLHIVPGPKKTWGYKIVETPGSISVSGASPDMAADAFPFLSQPLIKNILAALRTVILLT
jgi:hypothetical protein